MSKMIKEKEYTNYDIPKRYCACFVEQIEYRNPYQITVIASSWTIAEYGVWRRR